MPYIIDDKTIQWLFEQAEKYNSKEFNLGVVAEKSGVTGHTIKEFIPVIKMNESQLKKLYQEPEGEKKDTQTMDMWEYFQKK